MLSVIGPAEVQKAMPDLGFCGGEHVKNKNMQSVGWSRAWIVQKRVISGKVLQIKMSWKKPHPVIFLYLGQTKLNHGECEPENGRMKDFVRVCRVVAVVRIFLKLLATTAAC